MTSDRTMIFAQCGIRLRSEFDLNLPVAPGDGWDVDVHWGPDIADSGDAPPGDVIAAYDTDNGRWYTATSTGSGYVLRFHKCGEFVISGDLDEVEVRRDPGGQTEILPILMAGTVSAFLLTLRGGTVLHASAVKLGGSAIAFVGQSGQGKSTLAALLCVDGAELVTDDVLVVDPGPPVTCIGGALELRLRPAATSIADLQPDARSRRTADERLALGVVTATVEPLPLAAIVVPAPSRTATAVEVRRVPPSAAVFSLLAFPRVFGWSRPDVLSRDFATLSKVANDVPLFQASIPWGPPFDPAVGRQLVSLVDGSAPTP